MKKGIEETEVSRFGLFIKQKRKNRGITQKELARHARVSFTLVNRIENGDIKLNISSVNKVLKVFGCALAPVRLEIKE